MHVVDFHESHRVNTIEELESALMKRYDGDKNGFWLLHNDQPYPTLGVFVRGDLAYLSFIPCEYDAGFRSLAVTSPGPNVAFSISEHAADDIEVPGDAVVPFADAIRAAKEFFASNELPQCIGWFRL